MSTKNKHPFQETALRITRWIGSPASIAIHTVLFIGSFAFSYQGYVPFEEMLLMLTTIVSLEAIYLSLFIQMTVNYTTQSIEEVSQDIDEIQEDVAEIQEDVGEIQEDVDEIQEDVGEIQEDVDELQEDVEEMTEEEAVEDKKQLAQDKTLEEIQQGLQKLLADIEALKSR